MFSKGLFPRGVIVWEWVNVHEKIVNLEGKAESAGYQISDCVAKDHYNRLVSTFQGEKGAEGMAGEPGPPGPLVGAVVLEVMGTNT